MVKTDSARKTIRICECFPHFNNFIVFFVFCCLVAVGYRPNRATWRASTAADDRPSPIKNSPEPSMVVIQYSMKVRTLIETAKAACRVQFALPVVFSAHSRCLDSPVSSNTAKRTLKSSRSCTPFVQKRGHRSACTTSPRDGQVSDAGFRQY